MIWAILSIGILLGIVGFFWRFWNNRSGVAGVLMAIGIVSLIILEVWP
jgi:Flp pilus assembly protein TadG